MPTHSFSELRGYQHRIIKRVLDSEIAAILVDMSLGKTVSLLTAVLQMFESGTLTRGVDAVLVIAPIRVARAVWAQEAADWDHLQGLKVSRILGSAAERVAAIKVKADVYVLNIENVTWFFQEAMPQYIKHYRQWPWKVLIVDESSKFKHNSTKRFAAIRHKLKWFRRRYLLTGTPRSKSLLNVWSQIYLLDEGARLGTSFNRFKERFFMAIDYERRTWEPRQGADEYVQNLIRDITLRLDAADWLQLPRVPEPSIVWVDLEPRERAMYDQFEREMFTQLDANTDLMVFNAATVSGKCHQMANGAVYYDPLVRDRYKVIHDLKLDALEEVLAECQGNVMIAYQFRHDLERIRERLHPIKVPTLKDDTEYTIDQWNKGKIPYLGVQPASVAHGLNLQFGGHTITYFALTWVTEDFIQMIYRLRRPGQVSDFISLIPIMTRGTVDEAIYWSNRNNLRQERSFLDALNRYRAVKELLT